MFMWDVEARMLLPKQLQAFNEQEFKASAMVHPRECFNKILVGSEQGQLRLYNVRTCALVHTFKGWDSQVTCLEQTPVVNIVAIGLDDGRIVLHDIKRDATIATYTQKGAVLSLSFRTDGKQHMASAGRSGKVVIWDLERRTLLTTIKAHDAAVGRAQFLRDEPILVTNGADNSIKVWTFHNVDTLSEPVVLRERSGHATPPSRVAFYDVDSSATTLMTMSSGAVRTMHTEHSFLNRVLSGKGADLGTYTAGVMAASPRNHRVFDTVVTAHGRKVRSWDVERHRVGTMHKNLKMSANVTSLTLSACGNFIVVGAANGSITKFNVQSGAVRGHVAREEAHTLAVTSLLVDASNKYVISASVDGRVVIWRLADLTRVASLMHGTAVTLLAQHPESGLFASAADDYQLRVYDLATPNTPVRQFSTGTARVIDMVFSADGRWLVAACDDQSLRVFDVPSNSLIDWFLVDKPITSLAFSPKGEYLITTHVGELPIYLWSNQMHFGSVILKKPDAAPRALSMPTHASDKLEAYDAKAQEKQAAEEASADADAGVPTATGNSAEAAQDSMQVEEVLSAIKQIDGLITLSTQPKTKWSTLLNLDTIKERNKPIAPPKKPELAPFFLTTMPGLEPKFIVPASIAQPTAGTTAASEDDVPEPEGWENWVTPSDEQDESDSESTDKKMPTSINRMTKDDFSKPTTKFTLSLATGYRSQDYFTPSAIDFEIRSFYESDGCQDLHHMIDFLCHRLRSNDEFDMVQSLVNLVLRVHGERMFSAEFNRDLEELKQSQLVGWTKMQNRVFKDSYLDESFWNFSSQGPAFAVNPTNIEFIREPSDFYNHLLEGIKKATKRITFASLYLGTGKMEKALVDEMIRSCEKSPELKIHILLDGLRGSRESPSDSDPKIRVSSATMLLPLLTQFPDRVTISMYHTPDLNGILKKVLPPRVNETIGVNHIKTYVFDNDLLLSGANLSKDYFTNRQDRYSYISNTESVASYFDGIVGTVGTISMQLNLDGKVILPNGTLDPVTQSDDFKKLAEKKLSALLLPNTFYLPADSKRSLSSPFDAPRDLSWIFPTIQMGPFSIRHDEVVTSHIFENIPASSKLYITSPYFNLTSNYLELILQGRPKLDIITCSPAANGFAGAKGLSSAVPDCYAIIERRFLEKVVATNNERRISVTEYIRPKWSYHAKGLWITAQDKTLPSVTLIGSPNFGSRSVEKDLEAQMIIMTENPVLQQKMEDERVYLWEQTQDANLELFKERKISLWVKVLVYFFGNYL
eukprot:gene453-541_t